MKDVLPLGACPGVMQERAVWARRIAVSNPELVQVDDEMLPWSYHEEHEMWYSFNGNYSKSSPEEKFRKYIDSQARYKALSEQKAAEWLDKYNQIEYWSKIRAKVLKRDKDTCQICHSKASTKLHIHHILKRVEGGTDHFDNLITVCPSCHATADRSGYNPDWATKGA